MSSESVRSLADAAGQLCLEALETCKSLAAEGVGVLGVDVGSVVPLCNRAAVAAKEVQRLAYVNSATAPPQLSGVAVAGSMAARAEAVYSRLDAALAKLATAEGMRPDIPGTQLNEALGALQDARRAADRYRSAAAA